LKGELAIKYKYLRHGDILINKKERGKIWWKNHPTPKIRKKD